METLKKKLKFHEVETSIVEVKKHTQRGRPKIGGAPQVAGYQVQYQLSLDETSLDKKRATKGRFIFYFARSTSYPFNKVDLFKK